MRLTSTVDFGYPFRMTIKEELQTDWEKLCKRCGLCCFEKIENENGTIFFTSVPCRYLDVVSRSCRIYERRFKIFPTCIKLSEKLVRELDWLPDDCGYRQAFGLKRKRRKTSKH